MALAYWCEACGKVALDGDPPSIGCSECSPVEDRLTGWPLVVTWLGMIGGAWVLVGVALYGLSWVFQ